MSGDAHLWYWNFLDHWVRFRNRNVFRDVLHDDLDRFAIGDFAPAVSTPAISAAVS